MGKQFTKKRRRNARSIATAEIIEFQGSKFEAERLPPPIKALNPTQGDYLDALSTSPQVVVLGPAGIAQVTSSGKLVLHCVGDTGGVVSANAQQIVANHMQADLASADPPCSRMPSRRKPLPLRPRRIACP